MREPTKGAYTSVPVVFVTEQDLYGQEEDELEGILPLPASKYRYSKWYESTETEITSNMLKNPRIRKAPQGFKVDTIWMLEEQERESETGQRSKSETRRWGRTKKKDFRSKLENWEQCECVNLGFQDLSHRYQMKEFIKTLRKLVRAEMIELMHNSLSDLSSVSFPSCQRLYLQHNHLCNLKKLPRLSRIQHISLQENNITSLNGLEILTPSPLKSLTLRDNPVSLQPNYRENVFKILPNLVLLDDLPRLPKETEEKSTRYCCIF